MYYPERVKFPDKNTSPSNHQRCSIKQVFLEISQNSQENICTRASFLIKLQVCNFIRKRLWHRCFPVNFVRFLRTPFFIEHLWWLLIEIANERELCEWQIVFVVPYPYYLNTHFASTILYKEYFRCFGNPQDVQLLVFKVQFYL